MEHTHWLKPRAAQPAPEPAAPPPTSPTGPIEPERPPLWRRAGASLLAIAALLAKFAAKVVNTKLSLHALLKDIKARGERVYGIGAPSRARTHRRRWRQNSTSQPSVRT